jgi:hypothetical protein
VQVNRDRLFLVRPDFIDPAYPGQRFYCWHCALLEGLLASFPDLATRIDVERVAWERPRQAVIRWAGERNHSLPLLILADDAPESFATGSHGSIRFVEGKDAILDVLHRRHGLPEPHP